MEPSTEQWHLEKKVWEAIGTEMKVARSTIPTSLGRAPRNIWVHSKSFKAVEWWNWVELYSLPLLYGRLPEPFFSHWMKYVELFHLIFQFDITGAEIDRIQTLAVDFLSEYERIYYRYRSDALWMNTSNHHLLLHISTYINGLGPPFVFWQFAMERFCGFFEGMSKSRLHLNASLANAIVLEEQLHHILLQPGFEDIRFEQETSQGRTAKLECQGGGHFSSPKTSVIANFNLCSLLAAHYRGRYTSNCHVSQIQSNYIRWSSYSTAPDGEIVIGSKRADKRRPFGRASYNIRYDLLSQSAQIEDAVETTELTAFYGRVEEFIEHEYNGAIHCLALVRAFETTKSLPPTSVIERNNQPYSEFGYDRVIKEGVLEIIDAATINCSVGILVSRGVQWIIDRSRGVASVINLLND
jgi:hypothetical protein